MKENPIIGFQVDPADIHYRLGCALRRSGDLAAAKIQMLYSLEEAPRFRAAHRQLLEILAEMNENEGTSTETATEATETILAPEKKP